MSNSRYIKRSIESVLKKAVKEFPAVVLTGPRQAGKTTVLRHLFDKKYRYVSLETPDIRAFALEDPKGFLKMYPTPVIFDEIQAVPGLLLYIKEKIDQDREKNGQYLLTGSQNLLLSEKVGETLAGRAAILHLLPLSYAEIREDEEGAFPWERGKEKGIFANEPPLATFWEGVFRGSYPELVQNPSKDPTLWHSSYIQTYLERDVRTLKQVGDLNRFQLFMRGLAACSAQLLNLSDLAKEIGTTLNTAKSWLAVLETTHQVVQLRPYFGNIGKRLVKMPKVYFTDLGILCYLLGISHPDQLPNFPMKGAIFETAVFSEMFKRFSHRGERPFLSFYRTSSGQEVDFVLEKEGRLIPIEVKASSTPNYLMTKGLRSFFSTFQKKTTEGYLVHLGDTSIPLADKVTGCPFFLF